MIDEAAPAADPPIPPRMPKGHPANILRLLVETTLDRDEKITLIKVWWREYGAEYAESCKHNGDHG